VASFLIDAPRANITFSEGAFALAMNHWAPIGMA